MRAVVILPTYEERENLEPLVTAIQSLPQILDVLIVDDNSPDGTGELADGLAARFRGRVFVLHRERKEGLGPAYIAGFRHALCRMDHDLIVQMDADLSHDPSYVPHFLAAAANYDLVLGSRYLTGIAVVNWDFKRLLLSKTASAYIRLVTGLPYSDPTSGYKCWRRSALERMDLDGIGSHGYVFTTEMTYRAHHMGLRIGEIPIIFYERNLGRSKISGKIIAEAMWRVALLRIRGRRAPP